MKNFKNRGFPYWHEGTRVCVRVNTYAHYGRLVNGDTVQTYDTYVSEEEAFFAAVRKNAEACAGSSPSYREGSFNGAHFVHVFFNGDITRPHAMA